MIDHVYISVTDIEKSLAFYAEALKPLGWSIFGNYDSASGPESVPDLYGIGDDVYGKGAGVGSSIWLRKRHPGETGLYVGIVCDTNELVDAAYAAAIKAGGIDEETGGSYLFRPRLLRRQRSRLRRQPPRIRTQGVEPEATRVAHRCTGALAVRSAPPAPTRESHAAWRTTHRLRSATARAASRRSATGDVTDPASAPAASS
ncbi:hypothetical protein GPU89_34285 [Burkholderia cepacia]|nr:hypothetical protein [Burkholderia cepacia]